MVIKIESLSYEELLELNHIIVERLKYLDALNIQEQMKVFSPGDKVSFSHPSQGRLTGTLLKYDTKTVTIITQSGQKWNVSPNLLRKVVKPVQEGKESHKAISLLKK